MYKYLDLLQNILDNGVDHGDRTGTGRRSVYCQTLEFDLRNGFPLVTNRQIHLRSIIHELLWFISGSDSTSVLEENGVTIWKNWTVTENDVTEFAETFAADEETSARIAMSHASLVGSVGRIYGPNWRNVPTPCHVFDKHPISTASDVKARLQDYYNNFSTEIVDNTGRQLTFEEFECDYGKHNIDQMQNLITGLLARPMSSRHVVSSWIPQFIPNEAFTPQRNVLLGKGALAPCHVLQQYYVVKGEEGLELNLILYMRSMDVPIGTPYNIAQYALLLSMIAQVVGMTPARLHIVGGDVHIYLNQIELVKEQLLLSPLPLPSLQLNPNVKDLFAFTYDDIKIVDYQHTGPLKYPVSI